MLSYTQSLEDFTLWRAIGHVKEGFYIDIGAQDPVVSSISLLFYNNGWRGAHVEPSPYCAALLRSQRPGEDVLEGAVGAKAGMLRFFHCPETGLSLGMPEFAQKCEQAGYRLEEREVAVQTLPEILSRYADREVHWLKISCEGLESTVLSGLKSARRRPWIIAARGLAVKDLTPSHLSWERSFLEAGYDFAHEEGPYRYFVGHEHALLADALRGTASPDLKINPPDRHGNSAEMLALAMSRRAKDVQASAVPEVGGSLNSILEELQRANQARLADGKSRQKMAAEIASLRKAYEDLGGARQDAVRLAQVFEQQLLDSRDAVAALTSELEAARSSQAAHYQGMVAAQNSLDAAKRHITWRATAPVRWIMRTVARLRKRLMRGVPSTLSPLRRRQIKGPQVLGSPTAGIPSGLALADRARLVTPAPLLMDQAEAKLALLAPGDQKSS